MVYQAKRVVLVPTVVNQSKRVLGPTILTVNLSLSAFENSTQVTLFACVCKSIPQLLNIAYFVVIRAIMLYFWCCSYHFTIQNTSGHAWSISEGFTRSDGMCTDGIDKQYNPYEVDTSEESGYFRECSPQTQLRCAMGDLRRKLGPLMLEPASARLHKIHSFYDENLFLAGPFTSEFNSRYFIAYNCTTYSLHGHIMYSIIYISTLAFYAVFGRSIVVNCLQSSRVIGCARINTEPSVDTRRVNPINLTFSSKGTKLEDINRCAHITNCVNTLIVISCIASMYICGTNCTHGVNVRLCWKFYIPPYASSIFLFCQLL